MRIFLKKYAYIPLLCALLAGMLVLHRYIYLQGDDFAYGLMIKNGWSGFFRDMWNHHMNVNGRTIVHALVCFLLLFEMELFRITGPLLIVATITLMAKLSNIIGPKDKRNIFFACLTGVLLIAVMAIRITRQSLYWLDGSMNYIYPVCLLFLTYFLIRKGRITKKKYHFLPIIAFLAGQSVEQISAMTVGLLLLDLLFRKYVEKEEITKIELWTFIAGAIGAAITILAPGNFNRIGIESKMPFLTQLKYVTADLLHINFVAHASSIYYALIAVCNITWLLRYKNKKNLLIAAILTIGVTMQQLLIYKYPIMNQPTDPFMPPLANTLLLIFAAINMAAFLYTATLILRREKEQLPLIFAILGIGAQVMFVVLPVIGARTLVPSILVYFVYIAYTIQRAKKLPPTLSAVALITMLYLQYNKTAILIAAVLLLLINIGYLLTQKTILQKKHPTTAAVTLLCVILCCLSLHGMLQNIKGYKGNAPAHEFNIAATEAFIQRNEGKVQKSNKLVLQKVKDENYHWSSLYDSPYHRICFEQYKDIEYAKILFMEAE